MKEKILILFSVIFGYANAQNLVPNNSFENYSSCPTATTQLSKAIPWVMPLNTGTATSDFFNACTSSNADVPKNVCGYQNAHTGLGYVGLYTYGASSTREYIQVKLSSALVAGDVYRVEMYVSPAEKAGIAADAIGIYISANAISGSGNYYPLPYTPQISNPINNIISDTLGWTLVSGYYTATGGENYITIGNFLDDSNTNSLVFNSTGWLRGYYWIDDVSISISTGINEVVDNTHLHIYPNPFSTSATMHLDIFFKDATLTVFNLYGQPVKQINNISGQAITLYRDNLPSGLYVMHLTEGGKTIVTGKLVITDK